MKGKALKSALVALIVAPYLWLVTSHDLTAPYGIQQDELSYVATSYFAHIGLDPGRLGIWSAFSAQPGLYKVGYFLPTAADFLFGHDLLSMRKMAIVLNCASTLFLFLFSQYFLTFPFSCLCALLYSVAPFHFATTKVPFPGPFAEVFVYPTLILTHLGTRPGKGRLWILFLAGLTTLGALQTFNIAYGMPLAISSAILFRMRFDKAPYRTILAAISAFLLPMVLASPWAFEALKYEFQAKAYAFTNAHLIHPGTSLAGTDGGIQWAQHLSSVAQNIQQIFVQLFVGGRRELQDSLANYQGPIISPLISGCAIAGLLLTQRLGTYVATAYTLVYLLIFHGILGFRDPRMWGADIGVLFFHAAGALQWLYAAIKERTYTKTAWATGVAQVCAVGGLAFYIWQSKLTFVSEILPNPDNIAVLGDYREIGRLSLNGGISRPIIIPKSRSLLAHATMAFYFPQTSEVDLNKLYDPQSLGLLSMDQFQTMSATSLQGADLFHEIDDTQMVNEFLNSNGCSHSDRDDPAFREIRWIRISTCNLAH